MWSLEERLIIHCLQSSPNKALAELTQNNQVDWGNFIQQSTCHGVSGLLYAYSLQRGFESMFPAEVKDYLEKTYYTNIVQNMSLLKEVEKILPPLHEKGINPLFVQGMALLLGQSYSSLGMRPLTDIDCIVEPSQLETTKKALKGQGYIPVPFYPNLMSNRVTTLDIHTNIANIERISARQHAINVTNDSLWQKACAHENCWGKVYTLSAEDLIITSVAHLQKHSYSRLIWFVDIINTVEHYKATLDWQEITTRAKNFNLQKPLYITLTFLHKVFNCLSPLELAGDFLDDKLNIAESKLLAELLNGNRSESMGDFLYFCSITDIGKKILFLKETIFPRKEIMAQVFGFSNPVILTCCYPLRFFQSLWYGIKLLFSSLGISRSIAGAKQ